MAFSHFYLCSDGILFTSRMLFGFRRRKLGEFSFWQGMWRPSPEGFQKTLRGWDGSSSSDKTLESGSRSTGEYRADKLPAVADNQRRILSYLVKISGEAVLHNGRKAHEEKQMMIERKNEANESMECYGNLSGEQRRVRRWGKFANQIVCNGRSMRWRDPTHWQVEHKFKDVRKMKNYHSLGGTIQCQAPFPRSTPGHHICMFKVCENPDIGLVKAGSLLLTRESKLQPKTRVKTSSPSSTRPSPRRKKTFSAYLPPVRVLRPQA